MIINILTQPLFTNYGGILQNYALQDVLRRMGHIPLTLNIPKVKPDKYTLWKDVIKTGINFKKKIEGSYPCYYCSPHKRSVKEFEFSKGLESFIDKHINKINLNAPFTTDIPEFYPADAWIVGSDQVWRPWCSPYIENCFFDFLPENSGKRIAYAASFGTDKWEISTEKTAKLIPLAKRFDAISVREESGVKLANDFLDVEATHVVDPTLLLSAEDYLKIIPKNLLIKEKPKLITYILDPDKEKIKEIRKDEKILGIKEKKVGIMHKDRLDSIEEWLADFATADFVITDSFHGTVFSIIFNKPVKILKNPLRGNARLDSLLSSIPMSYNETGYYKMTSMSSEILEKYQDLSIAWLTQTLKD